MSSPPIVLVVDDDPDDIALLRRAISRSGVELSVVAVHDGADLVDFLRGDARFGGGEPVRPDLILLDLNMPCVDGITAMGELKAHDDLRTIPVVMLTTSDRAVDVERAYSAGAASYITKPHRHDQLVSMVQTLHDYWFETVALPSH